MTTPARPEGRDPFRRSLLGRAVWTRLAWAGAGLCVFWLAVTWAVAVP